MASKEYQIRWKQGDYIKLGKAVSDFNKKVKELQKIEDRSVLPALERYNYYKTGIQTRKEFNRVINSLRSFLKEGAEEIVESPSGNLITKWELKEARKGIKRGIQTLEDEIKEFEKTKVEKPYISQDEKQKRAELKNLRKFDTAVGFDFKRLVWRGRKWRELDRSMKKAIQYRENYMEAFENLKGFKNYEFFKNKLEEIKNPLDFYDYIQKSEIMSDLFLWYDDNAQARVYGGFSTNEDSFNYALEVDYKFKVDDIRQDEFYDNNDL